MLKTPYTFSHGLFSIIQKHPRRWSQGQTNNSALEEMGRHAKQLSASTTGACPEGLTGPVKYYRRVSLSSTFRVAPASPMKECVLVWRQSRRRSRDASRCLCGSRRQSVPSVASHGYCLHCPTPADTEFTPALHLLYTCFTPDSHLLDTR
jgi:hypothetical protein